VHQLTSSSKLTLLTGKVAKLSVRALCISWLHREDETNLDAIPSVSDLVRLTPIPSKAFNSNNNL
jgi:hypothetical protein